eukprot:CAMPEP_0113499032 /NCGR_PEP_ID=MMETSP0014_2-20120614/31518_1 /TAXON_ID=2857 /ORGANISM="Nitzschia sp." /LENGTH=215 /DNA_ID=CAMNT_0000393153 /DNA_START=180 /DNA_END=827 /DNA_ORIENTATION=- /assembly_acc=CAM_ASM_000159
MIRSSTTTPRVIARAIKASSASSSAAATASTAKRCMMSRAASRNDLVGLLLPTTTNSQHAEHNNGSKYYDTHRPKVSIRRTMQASSASASTARSYGTTLQLTSLDEPSGPLTWETTVRHYEGPLSPPQGPGGYEEEGWNHPTMSAVASAAESSAEVLLHGYVPSQSPATTEDGGDMLLDGPSAAAEVAMMIDTSYYHASYRSSSFASSIENEIDQ